MLVNWEKIIFVHLWSTFSYFVHFFARFRDSFLLSYVVNKVVFAVQAGESSRPPSFFSGGLYFVGSDLYRIGTINRELIASTFGRPPGWSVSQEVFAASSRLSTLKADYNSEVQGLLFFSALICFFTNWISHESDSILFTLWSQNNLSQKSIFCPNSHKRHLQKISLNKPNALFSR